ncbi:MAG: ankyrin repeat domain-containing protein, partial [Pyrinomonadaceae bacterium]
MDVNSANPGGQTALIMAALMGRSEIVSLLLEAGADVSLQDNHGLNASDWAQRRGFSEITELLTKTPPPEQRARATRSSTPESAGEAKPQTRPEAELEVESRPDDQASEERERRKSVGFGPAATAILKATTKQEQIEQEPERRSLEAEEAPSAEPASRPQAQKVGKGKANLLPSVAEGRTGAEPPVRLAEDVPVADAARDAGKEQSSTTTAIRSEALPTPQTEGQDPASLKAHGAGSTLSSRLDETVGRENDRVTTTAIRPERPPTRMPRGDKNQPSAKPHDAESALRIWTEPDRLAAGEAEPTAEVLQSRMETERIFEEARKRVEKEVRRRAQYETRSIGGKEPLRELGVTHEGKNVKRCPMCNTVYEDDTRTFCVYDSAPLISLEAPLSTATQTFGRPTLWALVAITLVGSIGVTYLVTSYAFKDNREPATAAL